MIDKPMPKDGEMSEQEKNDVSEQPYEKDYEEGHKKGYENGYEKGLKEGEIDAFYGL